MCCEREDGLFQLEVRGALSFTSESSIGHYVRTKLLPGGVVAAQEWQIERGGDLGLFRILFFIFAHHHGSHSHAIKPKPAGGTVTEGYVPHNFSENYPRDADSLARAANKHTMDTSTAALLLRKVHERDAEIWVLLQRTRLLNSAVKSRIVDDDHGLFATQGGMMGSNDALKERLAVVCGCQEKVIHSSQ